ncbi:MAG TPA: cyclic nucleotide-binding protein [Bacteroidetes bacterium]|nr:cyclic nucleotide-binding protein [Bacteroidota bacterium]
MPGMIEVFLSIEPLNEEIQQELRAAIRCRELTKGTHLLKFGEVDRYMHFVVQGSGRVYYLRDGRDITDYLAMDGQFLGGVESLFTGKASEKAIELTENSIIESIYYPSFEKLCARYHKVEHIGRKLALFAFLEAQKRIESIRFLSAAERYQELIAKYPGISNRIPLKHLASYLGTTQVSISRIRAGIQ